MEQPCQHENGCGKWMKVRSMIRDYFYEYFIVLGKFGSAPAVWDII